MSLPYIAKCVLLRIAVPCLWMLYTFFSSPEYDLYVIEILLNFAQHKYFKKLSLTIWQYIFMIFSINFCDFKSHLFLKKNSYKKKHKCNWIDSDLSVTFKFIFQKEKKILKPFYIRDNQPINNVTSISLSGWCLTTINMYENLLMVCVTYSWRHDDKTILTHATTRRKF